MSITLSPTDIERFQEASRTLLSSLQYGDIDDWRSAVLFSVKRLVGAEVSALILPTGEGFPVFSTEAPALERADEYLPMAQPTFERFKIFERLGERRVTSVQEVLGESLPAFRRSNYYQHFLKPLRCFDSIHVTMPPGPSGLLQDFPHMFLHKDDPKARFRERDLTLLKMLYPSFEAGVKARLRFSEEAAELAQKLDHIRIKALICDFGGRVRHVTPSLSALIEADLEAERMMEQLEKVAGSAARLLRGRRSLPPEADLFSRRMRTRMNCYRVRVCLSPSALSRTERMILITVDPAVSGLPSPDTLQQDYSLTEQQARVALLLIQRKSNRELADVLCISPHTARHHTQAVLEKLGVHSRHDVREKILDR